MSQAFSLKKVKLKLKPFFQADYISVEIVLLCNYDLTNHIQDASSEWYNYYMYLHIYVILDSI